jgi:hypothetical protein
MRTKIGVSSHKNIYHQIPQYKNTKNHISGIRALRFIPVKMEEDDDEEDEDEEKEETMKSTTHDHDCIFIVKM